MPAKRKFTTWCPFGDKCTKRGKQLGCFKSAEDARNALFNHLDGSTYHQDLSNKEIDKAVQKAEVEFWDEDEDDQERPKLSEARSHDEKPKGSEASSHDEKPRGSKASSHD